MRIRFLLIVAIAAVAGSSCGGNGDSWQPTTRNDYLVGYYLSASHVAEHYRHTTLSWARATEHSHAELRHIHESYGQQLVIDVGRFWFPATAASGQFDAGQYRNRLSQWWQGVDYPVWLLVPLDEPYHNMQRQGVHGDHGEILEQVTRITREVTGQRVGYVMTPESVVRYPVPAGADIAGVDCYGDTCQGRSYQQLIDTLAGQVRHTIIVPPAFDSVGSEADLITRLEQAKAVADSSPSVAAFVPFIWWSRHDGIPPWRGVEDMAQVKSWMMQFSVH